jgi:carbon-monoxide dehydrogenase medium subunit
VLSRPALPRFDYVKAHSLEDAVARLLEMGEAARLLMGGTDLLVRMRDGHMHPSMLVDVKHLPELRGIQHDDTVGLRIGAATTMNEVAESALVLKHCPLLAQAARSVASYQLRNRATLGGNLCNASPASDTAPALLALEGKFLLHGPAGEREVKSTEFFRGPGQTVMGQAEMMTEIRVSVSPRPSAGRYLKLGRNRAGDLAIAGVAVYGFDRQHDSGRGGPSHGFHIALASVAPVPLRVIAAERILNVQAPSERAFDLAASSAMEAARPISDVRASAAYRRAMVRNLTRRALAEVWQDLQTDHAVVG